MRNSLMMIGLFALCGEGTTLGQTAQLRGLGVLDTEVIGAASFAMGLSGDGRWIVGGSHENVGDQPQMRAVRWEWPLDGEPSPLTALAQNEFMGTLARAVSADGTRIVGSTGLVFEFSDGFHYQPFNASYWWDIGQPASQNGFLNDLYELIDITPDGSTAAGTTRTGFEGIPDIAVLWTGPDSTPQILGTITGSGQSQVQACNAIASVVVGGSHNESAIIDSFWWRPTEGMQSLPGLPRESFNTAFGVSPDGRYVVGALVGDAYLWFGDAASITVIPKLAGTDWAIAEDVSADGAVVVGYTMREVEEGYLPRAFMWDAVNGTRTIEAWLQTLGVDATGWEFHTAEAISDDALTVVGTGRNPAGLREAWAIRVGGQTCPADFNHSGDVDSSDFFAFLAAFFESSPQADFSHSGNVDSSDFFAFLAAFFEGC